MSGLTDPFALSNALREADAQEASGHYRPHRCGCCELRVIPCTGPLGDPCDACVNGDICDLCMYSYYHSSCIKCQERCAGCLCPLEEESWGPVYDHPLEAHLLYEICNRPGLPKYEIGDRVRYWAGAPGTGYSDYEIVSLDPPRGVLVESTVCELEPWEVY